MNLNVTSVLPRNSHTEMAGDWYKKTVHYCVEMFNNCVSPCGCPSNPTELKGKCFEIVKTDCVREDYEKMKPTFLHILETCYHPSLIQIKDSFKTCLDTFKDRTLDFFQERNQCRWRYINGENQGNKEFYQTCVANAQKSLEDDLRTHTENLIKQIPTCTYEPPKIQWTPEERLILNTTMIAGVIVACVAVGKMIWDSLPSRAQPNQSRP